ncbi:ankyrin repeat domain-containing protein [Bacillus massiliigorillae]|uniref:ankyrin repeat domain-containing protein n=1 Tax=Bacillus massiliigorillae TaxID=1243664 RepID=UPI000399A630|nr:ankyrin repeat domain-containing protein [Bacillus massiliigorillae]
MKNRLKIGELVCAIYYKRLDEVERLIQEGVNVNGKDEGGYTPLHWAAQSGNVDVVELLLSFGADVNAKDEEGFSPLSYANSQRNAQIVDCLLQYGADSNELESSNEITTVLFACCDDENETETEEVEDGLIFNSEQDYDYWGTSSDEEEYEMDPPSTTLLEETLGALEARLDINPVWNVQTEEGYTYNAQFTFNKGASEEEINTFENTLKVKLPVDYKEFLQRHNGAHIFIDDKQGMAFELLSLNEILATCDYADYPEGWFGIAYGFDGGMLAVNTNDINNDERNAKYLYWVDCCAYEDGDRLNTNFETFLDRFIVCQGTDYWKWFV